jgi:glycosyltransferase involved in cell wall biosynthesis
VKIFVLDAWLPTPDRDSASGRMFNLLQILREFGGVTFAADDFAARRSGLEALEQAGICVVTPPVTAREHLVECGSLYDVILLSRVEVANKYFAAARDHAPRARIVFDTTDLAYVRGFRGAKVMGNMTLLRRALEIKGQELALMRAADATLVVSTAEQQMLAQDCPGARVRILSNIHDVVSNTRPFGERNGIAFLGAFPHHPNADAMQYFCSDILPRVRKRLGNVKITIVGSQPPEWLEAMQSETFIVAGRIPDLAPLMQECKLTIAPLRYGSGVKGKVLTSMSCGVPVVATTIAAEGIPAEPRRDILIADDAASFAEAVDEVYRDEGLWNILSQNGPRIIEQYFSRAVARRALGELFHELDVQ